MEPILIALTILASIGLAMIGLHVALSEAGAVWPGVLLIGMSAALIMVGIGLAIERWGSRSISRRTYSRLSPYSTPQPSVAAWRFDRANRRRAGPKRANVQSMRQHPAAKHP